MKKSLHLLCFLFTGMLHLQSQSMYGLLERGGSQGSGAIIETDSNGNFKNSYGFPKIEGGLPYYSRCIELDSGIFYSTTYNSSIFEFNANTQKFTNKYNLLDLNKEGKNPFGSLIKASNGKLYGMTSGGGNVNGGVIYEYNTNTSQYTKLFDFDGFGNGGNPTGDLTETSPGIFYGMTKGGGTNSGGIIFEYNMGTATFTKKYDFTATSGVTPYGSLLKGSDGKLYGLTTAGGTGNGGTMFSFTISTGTFTRLHDFIPTTSGSMPFDLIEYSPGVFYGNATYGGTNNMGAIFKYVNSGNTFTKVFDFSTTTGKGPFGLVKANNGLIYGVCSEGGSLSIGNLFSFNTSTFAFTSLLDFTGANGARPACRLMQATDGKLYGFTILGGKLGYGNMFDYEIGSSKVQSILDFNTSPLGYGPAGRLIPLSKDQFLGACRSGGENNKGTLFIFDKTAKSIAKVFDFSNAYGTSPNGEFTKVKNGSIYSITNSGGAYGEGVLFKWNPDSSTFRKIIDFKDSIGMSPSSALIEAGNGQLYGTTYNGGSADQGVLYSFDVTTNIIKRIHSFNTSSGQYPNGDLCKAGNGKLYGVTNEGGQYNRGTIYELNTDDNSLKQMYAFSDSMGANPEGGMIWSRNGLLYGATEYGGQFDGGTLYSLDVTTIQYTKLYEFADTTYSNPNAQLLQAKNQKIYGSLGSGGAAYSGGLYEFDITKKTATLKFEYTESKGTNPYTTFVQYKDALALSNERVNKNEIASLYPNPNTGRFTLKMLKAGFTHYTILDMNGRAVQEGQLDGLQTDISITDLCNGIYVMLAINKDGTTIQLKLMKE